MLSFDIETEGLDRRRHRITVACVYDPERGIRRGFNLIAEGHEREAEEFLAALDGADALCSFNGARFDIPFIVQRYSVPHARYSAWLAKLFDYFEVSKVLFGSSCSLNNLLLANGMEPKTSSGMQAVLWAREERWEELLEYCMADTVLTHAVSSMARVVIPLTGMDHVVCTRRAEGCGLAFGPHDA